MSVSVAHVMSTKVFLASLDHSVDDVRKLMASKQINAVPVVGKNRKLMGIVTTTELARRLDGDESVGHVMNDMFGTISATETAGEAARLMRNRRIHHLIVTEGDTAVGIVSSHDLLRLVEEKF